MSPARNNATIIPPGPVVLDTSALLAFLCREPGGDVVAPRLRHALLSAVNYAETLGKLAEIGTDAESLRSRLDDLEVRVVEFTAAHAVITAALRSSTRTLGLSLGDRACLALGVHEQATVLTADRDWAKTGIAAIVRVIR